MRTESFVGEDNIAVKDILTDNYITLESIKNNAIASIEAAERELILLKGKAFNKGMLHNEWTALDNDLQEVKRQLKLIQ